LLDKYHTRAVISKIIAVKGCDKAGRKSVVGKKKQKNAKVRARVPAAKLLDMAATVFHASSNTDLYLGGSPL